MNMKKILFILFLPLFAFADCQSDCSAFKSSMQSNIDSMLSDSSSLSGGITSILYWVSQADSRAANIQAHGDSTGDAYYIRQELSTATYNLNSIENDNQEVLSLLSSSQSLLNSLDCSVSNDNCCPDLSTIEGRLLNVYDRLIAIYNKIPNSNSAKLQEIRDIVNYISGYYEFLVMDTGDIQLDVNAIRSYIASLSDSQNAVLPLLRQVVDSISNQVNTVQVSVTNDFTIVVTNSTDVSGILSRIDTVNSNLSQINRSIDSLSIYLGSITNQLRYTNFLLEHGFNGVTNLFFSSQMQGYFDDLWVYPYSGDWYSDYTYFPETPSGFWSFADILESILFNTTLGQSSLNNFNHGFISPSIINLTNTVGFIHRDTTNFFSFFRGEIGVQGVLSDWQSQQVNGSYHDFLTNHYLTVVRGGSLSGNQSTKTNWFSRIETLIAALVFTDSASTNTVDTSSGSQERTQLQNSYGNVNQSASAFSQNFGQTSDSIVSLYRSYFETFDNAAMPSHVVLMRLSDDSSEDIEITFQSDAISSLVEACRVVSTFCWASVGIFLLYKFLVWAARSIVLTCQFVYRVISSVFK